MVWCKCNVESSSAADCFGACFATQKKEEEERRRKKLSEQLAARARTARRPAAPQLISALAEVGLYSKRAEARHNNLYATKRAVHLVDRDAVLVIWSIHNYLAALCAPLRSGARQQQPSAHGHRAQNNCGRKRKKEKKSLQPEE